MVDAKGFLYRCFSLDVLVEYRKWIVGKPHFRKRIPFTGFFGKKKGGVCAWFTSQFFKNIYEWLKQLTDPEHWTYLPIFGHATISARIWQLDVQRWCLVSLIWWFPTERRTFQPIPRAVEDVKQHGQEMVFYGVLRCVGVVVAANAAIVCSVWRGKSACGFPSAQRHC